MKHTQKFRYYFTLFWFRIISLLPFFLQKVIAQLVYFNLAYLFKYRKKVIYENLQNSFPEKTVKEIEQIAKKYYRNLSFMFVENASLRFINPKKIPNRITINNEHLIKELTGQNRNILAAIGHIGNWEYGSMFAGLYNYKGGAVYKKLADPVFDRIFYDLRSQLGATPIEMRNVVRALSELNKTGDPFMLFLIADQSPMKHEITYWLDFLHQDTGVYLGPEKLAVKYNMPVVYLELIRTDYARFELNIELIARDPKEMPEFEIIKRFYQILENSIRKNPDQWLWSHRRWKHRKPE